jgi:hypothetical protein
MKPCSDLRTMPLPCSPMRVLMATPRFLPGGGVERHVERLAERLAAPRQRDRPYHRTRARPPVSRRRIGGAAVDVVVLSEFETHPLAVPELGRLRGGTHTMRCTSRS